MTKSKCVLGQNEVIALKIAQVAFGTGYFASKHWVRGTDVASAVRETSLWLAVSPREPIIDGH